VLAIAEYFRKYPTAPGHATWSDYMDLDDDNNDESYEGDEGTPRRSSDLKEGVMSWS
jgi:hypothetical protein